MSEHAPHNQEHLKDFEELAESSEHLLSEHAEKNEHQQRQANEKLAQDIQEARQDIAETARSDEQLNPIEKLQEAEKAAEPPAQGHVNRELKQATLQRELTHIRRHLSAPQRQLSKVIHQPVVRKVSEVSSKTVSRPSGLLGGSLLAFIGSSGYLYLAKHQGFRYNYGFFLALFFGGFLVGLTLELLVWTATHSRRHATD